MSFELNIVTPEGRVYQGRVESVVLPGSEGDFGVLGGHERFLAPLRVGEIEIRDERGHRFAAVSGGFADVSGQQVVVLAETCELAERIDTARAQRARERAERELRRLRELGEENHHFRLEEAALERALIRIQAAARAR